MRPFLLHDRAGRVVPRDLKKKIPSARKHCQQIIAQNLNWRNLSLEEKTIYEKKHAADTIRYEKQIRMYIDGQLMYIGSSCSADSFSCNIRMIRTYHTVPRSTTVRINKKRLAAFMRLVFYNTVVMRVVRNGESWKKEDGGHSSRLQYAPCKSSLMKCSPFPLLFLSAPPPPPPKLA